MMNWALIVAALSVVVISHAHAEKGHYSVNDGAVITGDTVAEANCKAGNLQMYKVDKQSCLVAAKHCLADLEANKVDLEADPMYQLNCMMRELDVNLSELMNQ